MREALLCDSPSDVVSSTNSNRSHSHNQKKLLEKDSALLLLPPPPLPVLHVGRSRSQGGSTRRVTPTTTAVATSAAFSVSVEAIIGIGATTVEKALPNGDLYIGSFSGSVPHGSGKYLWADGCMYEGEWRRGKASGKGKFSWPSGATYEGEFKSGRMEGFGTFIGSDGDTYRGSWSSDRKHGYGQKRYANGDFYEGSWKRNLQDGQGRYVWKNGNEYVGEWKNGVINGRGVLIWANGNRYDGQWENGVPKGNGVFTWPDGSCYVGSWNKDMKIHHLNGTFYPGNSGKDLKKSNGGELLGENLTITMRKRSSVDGAARGSVADRGFPRICIWESDGEAGDITCDIIDNVEASMLYRNGISTVATGFDCDFRQFRRNPCYFSGEAKKPGLTIAKGHKNYDLMLNLQLGIR